MNNGIPTNTSAMEVKHRWRWCFNEWPEKIISLGYFVHWESRWGHLLFNASVWFHVILNSQIVIVNHLAWCILSPDKKQSNNKKHNQVFRKVMNIPHVYHLTTDRNAHIPKNQFDRLQQIVTNSSPSKHTWLLTAIK